MFRFQNGYPVLSRIYAYSHGQKIGVFADGKLFEHGKEIPEPKWKAMDIHIRQELIFDCDCLTVYRQVKQSGVLSDTTAYYAVERQNGPVAVLLDDRNVRKLAILLKVKFCGGQWKLTGSNKGFISKKWVVVNENYLE